MKKWFFLFLLLSATVEAKDFSTQGPFTIRTQQPLYLQTANLNPARALSLPQGFLELRFDQAYSNLYERHTDANSDINLDMELYRLGVNATYGLLPDLEIGLELPLMRFEGGFLDSFIQNFHDFFGFPNGGREEIPNGAYLFRVRETGRAGYEVGQQSLKVGDLSLSGKYQFFFETQKLPAIAARAVFKMPSGNPDTGMGSGRPGFGLGAALEKSYKRLHGFLNTNYLFDGGNEYLPGLMNKSAFNFSIAGEFSLSRRTSVLVQLVGGTPRLTGTGLNTWDGVPLDLVIGAAGDQLLGGPTKIFFWQVAFSEDVTARGPSVDFTVWGSVGIRFPVGRSRGYKGDFFAFK